MCNCACEWKWNTIVRYLRLSTYICLIKCYIHVQEEEEQFGPLLVGTLEQHGIAATDVKKLMVSFFLGSWSLTVEKIILRLFDPVISGGRILHSWVRRLCPEEEAYGDQGIESWFITFKTTFNLQFCRVWANRRLTKSSWRQWSWWAFNSSREKKTAPCT